MPATAQPQIKREPHSSISSEDVARNSATSALTFRSDQFYGKPIATSVKEILEQRHARNAGAISLDELFKTMKEGGFVPLRSLQ